MNPARELLGNDADATELFTLNLVVGFLADQHFRAEVKVATAEEKHLAEVFLKLIRAGT